MSSGALIQLIAYGAQDIYLMGQPQMTYWKTVYKRFSNYALESVEIPINGTINTGSKVTITIPKSGDLLKRLWIHYNPSQLIPGGNPSNVEYICSDLGHALIEKMEFEIGGQIIDTQYGKWLSIWRDLTQNNPYSSSGFISDLYPNYSATCYQGLSNKYGNVLKIATQGEEPTSYYNFISSTSINTTQTPLNNENGQAIVLTNNNESSWSNNVESGAPGIQKDNIALVPLSNKLNINFTNRYDTLAYTHIGTQNINSKTIAQLPWYTNTTGQTLNLSTSNAPTEAYVPLQFWFSKNPGLALPLIALQYHEVKLNMTFATSNNWVKPLPEYQGSSTLGTVTTSISSVKIFADYVYLDSTERKNYAQNAHEYLMDQIQLESINNNGTSNTQASFELNFNHPVKELIITGNPEYYVTNNTYNPTLSTYQGRTASGATPAPIISSTEYPNDYGCPVAQTNTKMTLTFNGTERFSPRNLKYFTRQQIFDHHKGSGGHYFTDDIAVYSFALKPEENQPSGTCNMSRLDRVYLNFTDINTLPDATETLKPLDVYAVNQNVLRIMSGMGGLAYSN